jgi:hypothetical protein
MSNKKILSEEELMVNYAEMTSFDFDALSADQLRTINNSEYSGKPSAFKFGNFDLLDLVQTFFVPKTESAL